MCHVLSRHDHGSVASSAEERYRLISDYAVIGDCRSAALVSSRGSIDWCCWPRFDSASIFARLLDHDRGGFYEIQPRGEFRTHRRYLPGTNVLETTFVTESGEATLTDLMPVIADEATTRVIAPYRMILRRLRCTSGEVAFTLRFEPRFRYGEVTPALRLRGPRDAAAYDRSELLHLRCEVELQLAEGGVSAQFALHAGEQRDFALAYTAEEPAVIPPLGEHAEPLLQSTLDFWRDWSSKMTYEGPHRAAVERSALALKLMVYAPSGAIVAAPTTSLPEHVGGVRNWDYRYCWLRDASFTVDCLYDLGYTDEADHYVDWLLHTTTISHPEIHVLYSVYGEAHLPERSLKTLEGYRGSAPVRIGNDAHGQFQIDVYGELLGALQRAYGEGKDVGRDKRRLFSAIADTIAARWNEPDHGIWEVRSGLAHHVHGKALAWKGLDCAVALAKEFGMEKEAERWGRVRDEVRASILERGFKPELGAFTGTYDSDNLDAAVLVLSRIGVVDGADPRYLSTIDLLRERLTKNDLVYRYRGVDDGLPGDDGAFLACSFWMVDALTLAGRRDESEPMFARLLAKANDLGLFSEEMDPETGMALGNFPQALTHIAVINSALALARVEPQSNEETKASMKR